MYSETINAIRVSSQGISKMFAMHIVYDSCISMRQVSKKVFLYNSVHFDTFCMPILEYDRMIHSFSIEYSI